MEVSIHIDQLKFIAYPLEALSKFSAFAHLQLTTNSINIYSINSALSSYASLELTEDYFEDIRLVDASILQGTFKISTNSLLSLFKTKKLVSPILQLIFTKSRIVSIFKGGMDVEKIYKFSFEEVDKINIAYPIDKKSYTNYTCILTKHLWNALIPHTLMLGKQNELTMRWTLEGLTMISRVDKSYQTSTFVSRAVFYEYNIRLACEFTLIKSEVIGMLTAAERTESLFKLHFGLPDSPVIIEIDGIGDGCKMKYIMSVMIEDGDMHDGINNDIPNDVTIAESDSGESLDIEDDLAIPGTPEYVY